MSDTTKAEEIAQIKGMFKRICKYVIADIADIKVTEHRRLFMVAVGQAIIRGLKQEATPEIWDEIEGRIGEEIEVKVSERTEKAVRLAIERILKMKGISVLNLHPLERMEMEYVLKDLGL